MIIYSLIFFLFVVFLYFSVLIFKSLKRTLKTKSGSSTSLPLSVIIAVKNESQNIDGLIKSLKHIDYPSENLEIIFVNDDSSDDSYEKIRELIKDRNNFKILQAVNKPYEGKKGALSIGISTAKYHYIMITDADCRPGRNWLRSAAAKFTEGYDVIFGNAPFYTTGSLANKISCFENLRTSILSFGLAGAGIFYSAAARNFGFKKSSFEKLNGYANTSETLSGDDDLLIREAVKNNFKIGIILNDGSTVYSYSKETLREYFTQRARHTKTSFYYLPATKFILTIWHLCGITLTASVLLSFISPLFLIPFSLKIVVDVFIIRNLQGSFGYKRNTIEIIYLQIIYEFILVIHFLNAAFRIDKWK